MKAIVSSLAMLNHKPIESNTMTQFTTHNPDFANPIMGKLLNALSDKWSDSSYGDDLVASISRDIPNPDYQDYMTVLLPNSTQHNIDKEEVNNYAVKCGDESDYLICETLEETIKTVKEFESNL